MFTQLSLQLVIDCSVLLLVSVILFLCYSLTVPNLQIKHQHRQVCVGENIA